MSGSSIQRASDGSYRCPECGESWGREIHLRSHWGQVHDGPAPWWPEKENAERNGVWWNHQRKRALERDNDRCQNCEPAIDERLGDRLHVHHIRAYEIHTDGEFPHRLENLVTLCDSCHPLFEVADKSIQHDLLESDTATHPAEVL